MNTCITCGMPLAGDHVKDIGIELPEGSVCKYDSENGRLKSGKEIFEGGVEFFMGSSNGRDRDLASRLTRKNMKSLPYWQAHPFAELEGDEASDEEMRSAMSIQ